VLPTVPSGQCLKRLFPRMQGTSPPKFPEVLSLGMMIPSPFHLAFHHSGPRTASSTSLVSVHILTPLFLFFFPNRLRASVSRIHSRISLSPKTLVCFLLCCQGNHHVGWFSFSLRALVCRSSEVFYSGPRVRPLSDNNFGVCLTFPQILTDPPTGWTGGS